MPGAATGRYTDPEHYVADFGAIAVELVVTRPGRFDGRLISAHLPHIDLLCAQETLPRIAYVSLPSSSLCMTFLMRPGPTLLLNGVALQPGEIAFHASGERFHQRTTGAARWGLLAIAPRFASIYLTALTGPHFRFPAAGVVFCPPSAAATKFLRLHARIGRLAETRSTRIGHPEVARAMEQELICELMACLCGSETRSESASTRRHADILARLEYQLEAHPDRVLSMPELCAIVGISQRTLTTCCREFLGMSPAQYLRLRRVSRVRKSILNADPNTATVNKIARSQGFTDLGRFAASYREAFGETPSMTLYRLRCGTAAGDAPFFRPVRSPKL
jgi:AraC-like DNA-binding protein